MKIVWTDEAVGQLETIVTYIGVLNPAAATRLGERLVELADSLVVGEAELATGPAAAASLHAGRSSSVAINCGEP